MKYFFKHIHTVNHHKWEVFKLCCKCGIPLNGILHDLSKFSYEEMSESIKYYRKSNGKYSPLAAAKKEVGYSKAWLHHFGRNKHHFEYWYDYTAPIQTPIIPYKYMVEMICDRIAASKVYNKENYDDTYAYKYFMNKKDSYRIHPAMNNFMEEVLYDLSKKGEKILNKTYLKKIYNKHVKESNK